MPRPPSAWPRNRSRTSKTFLSSLADNIDAGVGSMVDANMEEEAARLQALQVQQQLATQSLSIANQATAEHPEPVPLRTLI